MPADLVMAHVSDIEHPMYKVGIFDYSFSVFGIVKMSSMFSGK